MAELLPKGTISGETNVDEIKKTYFAEVTSCFSDSLPINFGAFICIPLGNWDRYIQMCFDYTSSRCYYRIYRDSWNNWLQL